MTLEHTFVTRDQDLELTDQNIVCFTKTCSKLSHHSRCCLATTTTDVLLYMLSRLVSYATRTITTIDCTRPVSQLSMPTVQLFKRTQLDALIQRIRPAPTALGMSQWSECLAGQLFVSSKWQGLLIKCSSKFLHLDCLQKYQSYRHSQNYLSSLQKVW